ncbi:MAG: hypothetical protein U0Y82_02890 [Thermoleophilia bacterium]
MEHTASNQLARRDVRKGDTIYVVTVREGTLVLVGKLLVDRVVDAQTAAETFQDAHLWEADWHALGADGPMTPVRARPVSEARLEQITLIEPRTRSEIALRRRDDGGWTRGVSKQ